MQYRISCVPYTFDAKNPIISRSSDIQTKLYQHTSFSFRNIIKSTASHLVAGYVTNKNLQIANETLIPNDIKQLCFDYFIGKFPYSIRDDKLSELNDNAKNEFIQISLHLLCVGNDIYYTQLLLSHLINLFKCCERSLNRDLLPSSYNYLSLLSSLTEIVDFYSVFTQSFDSFRCNDTEITDAMHISENCSPEEERTIYLKLSELTCTAQKDILYQQYKKYGNIESINIAHKCVSITFTSTQAIRRYEIDSQMPQLQPNESIDYNKLVMCLACRINDIDYTNSRIIAIELIYRLLQKQNAHFYKLYIDNIVDNNWKYHDQGIRAYISFIQQNQLDILGLRKLLIPVVFQHEVTDISLSSFAIQRLINNDTSLLSLLSWLWLQKEVEDIVLNAKDKIYLYHTLTDILTVSQVTTLTAFEEIYSFKINKVRFEVLYLLSEVANINIVYKIYNVECFQKLIIKLLREDKYGIIGWKILNMEIDKMSHSGKEYEHFNNWKYFIEAKTGLLQMNIVSNINILKEEKEGNEIVSNAHNQLQLSTLVCFKIHKLSKTGGLRKFNKLYAKIKKTKLLKPILAKI